MTDSARTLLEIPRTRGEVTRIRLTSYRGSQSIDSRIFYRDADNVLRPSRSGVSIPVAALPALIGALELALAETRKATEGDAPAP